MLQWGSVGRSDGKFIYPLAIEADDINNLVYVTDPYNSRVQVFDKNGNFVYQWGRWDAISIDKDFSHLGGIVSDGRNLFVSAGSDIVKFKINEFRSVINYGDVNGIGGVDANDASLTAMAAVGLATLTDEQLKKADVNKNSQPDANDASLIAQYAVGLIDKF